MAFIFGANAQQNSSATDEVTKPFYKFYKGSVATELNFSLFNINITDDGVSTGSFAMPELRLRFGLSDKLALRVNLGLDFGHDKIQKNLDNTEESYYRKTVVTGDRLEKNSYTTFSIAPGIEYHFGKWNRMSIYVGGEIPIGFYMTNSTIKEDKEILELERGYYSEQWEFVRRTKSALSLKTKNYEYGYYYSYPTGKMFFGINAFAGFDFYVYKGLYLGAELGLGYNHAIALKGYSKGSRTREIIYLDNSPTIVIDEIDEKFEDKMTGGHLGFRCNPMIRLGWRF